MLNATPSVETRLPVFRRIVAVQGAVQLTAALAAMRAANRGQANHTVENHLIVHDLSAPIEQERVFVDCLHELAMQADTWTAVHYITALELDQFAGALSSHGWESAAHALRRRLNLDKCEQLLLGQNLLFMNQLLHRSFSSAETACYGDGIGLNFTPDYFNPGQSSRSLPAMERWLRLRIKRLLGKRAVLSKNRPHLKENMISFNKHYLLLANHFDQKLNRYEQLDLADFCEIFSTFAEHLPRLAASTCETLEHALKSAEQVVVLLTSNFSETKRMTLEGELTCCLDQTRRLCKTPNTLLVIKPHPRDSLAKIHALVTEASKTFRTVIALTDSWTFFIPFESIFVRFFASNPRVADMTHVVCSSSACVSLEYLYRQRCQLGFGVQNIRQHFARKWRKLRERHEFDLHRLVDNIRNEQLASPRGR